jgi:hypothetical protein
MSFPADELYCIWYGLLPPSDEEASRFEAVLRDSAEFTAHPQRLFEFAPAPPKPLEEASCPTRDFQELAERIDAKLPADAKLLRKSYQPGVPHMLLVFAFPDVARERFGAELERIFLETGWTYEIHPRPNPAALASEIGAAIPEPTLLARSPSIHLEERRAKLHLSRALQPDDEAAWAEALAHVRAGTGFELELVLQATTPTAKVARDSEGRLEINMAYLAVRSAFADEPVSPRRIGRKTGAAGGEPYVELSFISPEVGARYRTKLDALAQEIGWPLQVSPKADQNAIVEAARSLLRDHRIRRGPSFAPADRKVKVELESAVPSEEWERIQGAFEEVTGYRLEAK